MKYPKILSISEYMTAYYVSDIEAVYCCEYSQMFHYFNGKEQYHWHFGTFQSIDVEG